MLNLISDAWIPVYHRDGIKYIRPDEIADPEVLGPAWPRPDLNLACYELLIGLVYLAYPPEDEEDLYKPPNMQSLRAALEPLIPAFNLLGDGPKFLQDIEKLEGEPKFPDMLFIDSAGEQAQKRNTDLMVKRSRYKSLPLPLAAMALYTLQTFAPSGGAGNRTSMRGGGPLTTLVKPKGKNFLDLIWLNVPYGLPLQPEEFSSLPWMRSTKTSERNQVVTPSSADYLDPEMFFGQPRRLQLISEGDGQDAKVTGVIQRNYGTNYTHWIHFLSPYYNDAKGQKLPVHPKPGKFGYQNWRGVILQVDKAYRPKNLERLLMLTNPPSVDLIVAGWAMDNMKPLDFLWSEQPIFHNLTKSAEETAISMVEAAEQASIVLAMNVQTGKNEVGLSKGSAEAARQSFFVQTQQPFLDKVNILSKGNPIDLNDWLKELQKAALNIFDEHVLPGLEEMDDTRRKKAVNARKNLFFTFKGYGKFAEKIYKALDLNLPPKPSKKRSGNEK